jgi:hypothetical protein
LESHFLFEHLAFPRASLTSADRNSQYRCINSTWMRVRLFEEGRGQALENSKSLRLREVQADLVATGGTEAPTIDDWSARDGAREAVATTKKRPPDKLPPPIGLEAIAFALELQWPYRVDTLEIQQ